MKVKWKEPVDFYRAHARSIGAVPTRRKCLLAGLTAAAVVAVIIPAFQLFFYLLHKKDLGVPVYAYFVAPALAGVFVGFLPTMLLAIPATIVLNEKGVYRLKPIGSEISQEFWPWESISALAIEDVKYGEEVYRVLVFPSPNAPGEVLLGLGETPPHRIAELVRQMGKTLVKR